MNNKTLWTGALIAGALGVLQILVSWDPETVTDWRAWAVSLGGAFIRPAAASLVAKLVTK